MHPPHRVLLLVALLVLAALPRCRAADASRHDVVVYGGTSGGIVAAIQARAMGRSVVLVEPGRHLGGLTSGGLGATDIGNKGAIGGLSRAFYRRVGRHYAASSAWVHERAEDHAGRRRAPGEEEMWTFEPHVAEGVFREWLAEAGVETVLERRLDRTPGGVSTRGGRIESIRTLPPLGVAGAPREFPAAMFIDATYEGDLMAAAGVSFHVGREANALHGETLNGIQTARAVAHQFTREVDPWVVPGDPSSGLLPLVDPAPPGVDGDGDARVQAYCFRVCTTDVPANRGAWRRPEGYDERTYEILFRNFEAGDTRVPWNPVFLPNRKTDTNNNFAVSTDFLGGSHAYPLADDAARAEIVAAHRRYQEGLLWTLANHPRVPEGVREHFRRLGPALDEFTDNGNWPTQLYVREARRMVSDVVMNQNHCQQRVVVDDPVGLGAYNMDSHNVRRHVDARGRLRNEGDIQVGVSPYRISWRSIRPRREEALNLLVPVCLSASHVAYGSIRMEPVFMVLGQSAATAAVMAIERGVAVQDVPYDALRSRLLADGQILEWTGPVRRPAVGRDLRSVPGVVVDNTAAELGGTWSASTSIDGFVHIDYLHDGNEAKGEKQARYVPDLPAAGRYEIRIHATPASNRATNVPVSLAVGGVVVAERTLNQRVDPGPTGSVSLGVFTLPAGRETVVTISTAGTDGHVVADAVAFVPVAEAPGR